MTNNIPSKKVIERLKNKYKDGCRVMLDEMNDPYANVPSGTKGTVIAVDDIGSIHVKWDNGSSLAVVYGEDCCHVIEDE